MLEDDLVEIIPLRGITKQRIRDLDREFLTRLIDLLRTMPVELSERLTIGSAMRYSEEQQRAYNAYKMGYGGLAARPGTSRHEFGEAVDFWPPEGVPYNPRNRKYREALAWLYENAPLYGIRGLSIYDGKRNMQHDTKDLVHFQKMSIDEWQRAVPEEYPERDDINETKVPLWERLMQGIVWFWDIRRDWWKR